MICEMLCEMMTTVRSFLMASRLFLICSVATASRLAVGSSRKMMDGFFRNMRAMAIFCCWPPDRSWAGVSRTQGQGLDLLMDKGLAGCFQNFLASGFGLAVADVFLHRAVEDVVFLEYQADVAAYEGCVVVGQRHAVQQQCAGIGLVEFVQQVDKRAFARAGQAHQGGNTPGGNIHVDILEGGKAVARIGETHAAQGEIAAQRAQVGSRPNARPDGRRTRMSKKPSA